MNCSVCKSGIMRPSTDSYFARINGAYVIIENVPCYKCEQCGEIVFSASVMEKIDDMLEHLKKLQVKSLL